MSGSHLISFLITLRRRLRLRDGWLVAQRTLWVVFAGAIGILVLGRLVPIDGLAFWIFSLSAIWLCALLLYAVFHPRPLKIVAQQADLELGLKERLSTAYELEIKNPTQFTGFPNSQSISLPIIQHHDALSIAHTIDPHHAFPLRWLQRPTLIATAILVAALILVYLPNPMDALLAERIAVEKVTQEQVEKIEKLREEIEQSKKLTPELQAELLRQLEVLTEQLSDNPGDREKALADLSNLEEELRRKLDPNTDLRQASLETIASRLKSLAQQDNYHPPAFDKALENIATKLTDMSETEQQELAKAMAQMAAQAAQSGNQTLAQALASMSQAALSADSEAASQAASEISEALVQAQGELSDQQALQQALSQLQNSSQTIAQAGQADQQIAGQGPGQSSQGDNPGQGNNPGQGQNGQGMSGGGTKADALPPGTGSGQARHPEDINTGAAVGNLGEQVFIPWERPPNEAEGVSLPGQDTGQGETIIRENPNPSGGLAGPTLIPYQHVYTQYMEAAQQAINRGNIPSAYRDLVHDYFTQLEP